MATFVSLVATSPAQAAPVLTIAPITWNVIGLDSNDVSAGPNVFPVGARVCNTGDTTATNVQANFVWDSANALINLSGSSSISEAQLAAGACQDFYFDVVITRSAAAYDTTRSYHITATADGIGTVSTPTPREVYVERLVSQNRNTVTSVSGPSTVLVGGTYDFTLVAATAPGGYEQLESFVTFPNVIFSIEAVSTTYSAPAGGTNDKFYADACGWDNVPTSPTYRECVGPALYPGGKAGGDITTVYTVKILSAGSTDLTALIYDFSGSSYHYNSDFGESVLSVTAVDSADLSITKGDSPDPVVAGEALTYTLSVSNAGPSDAANVTVTDDLPAGTTFVSAAGTGWSCGHSTGTVTCTRPTVGSGNSAPDIAISVTAPPSGGTITNEAEVTASTGDPDPTDNTISQDTAVTASADLAVSKSHSGDFTVGQNGTYAITVTNSGPSAAAADLVVTDTLPNGLTFVSGGGTGGFTCSAAAQVVTCTRTSSLASGGSATFDITVAVGPSAAPGVTNVVSVSSPTTDADPADNSTSDPTTVQSPPPPPPPEAEVSIDKLDSRDPVTTGATFDYTLRVTNAGPSDATGVTVVDSLPAGTSLVTASGTGWTCNASGGTVTCTRAAIPNGATAPAITVTVTAPSGAGPITNSATVTATEIDPSPANNSDSEGTVVQLPPPPPPEADVSIVKSDSPDPVITGATLDYTLRVTNAGPSNATGVSVSDGLPAGTTFVSATGTGWTCNEAGGTVTCTRAAIPNGATAPAITVTVTAPSGAGPITNSATVTATEIDPSPGNNSASEGTAVQLPPPPPPTNDPPVAVDDTAATAAGTPVAIGVTANDSDPDGNLDPATVLVTSPPGNGTVTCAPNGVCTYTPAGGFSGVDTFDYRVCDSDGDCDSARVTITVAPPPPPPPTNDPPVAVDDTAATAAGTPVAIGVTANDSDPDGNLDPATVLVTSPPGNGTVTCAPNGVCTYTPAGGFSGVDTFDYRVCDSDGDCDSARVTITVAPPPPPPTPIPTPTPSPTPIPTPTPPPSATPSPSTTPTPSPPPSFLPTSPSPSPSPSFLPTSLPTERPTPVPVATLQPTDPGGAVGGTGVARDAGAGGPLATTGAETHLLFAMSLILIGGGLMCFGRSPGRRPSATLGR